MATNEIDFTKEYFQRTWGKEGYYEKFNYGVGIDTVCSISIVPFFGMAKNALEIGCGGGVFTERMINKFGYLTAIDVIEYPQQFFKFNNFSYIEQKDRATDCEGVQNNSIDFCFCYNLFCHLSNEMLVEYLKSVFRVLKRGGDFVFMIANFKHSKIHVPDSDKYKLGDLFSFGHFYQDDRTIDVIADKTQWQIINRNMIPEHRDILIHLKKK